MRKLTQEQKRDTRAIAVKKDKDIDFSDAPAIVDWSGAEIGEFYRPTKKPITMRLDSDVIAWLKADDRGYQTTANWLLRQAKIHLTEATGTTKGKKRSTTWHGQVRMFPSGLGFCAHEESNSSLLLLGSLMRLRGV